MNAAFSISIANLETELIWLWTEVSKVDKDISKVERLLSRAEFLVYLLKHELQALESQE